MGIYRLAFKRIRWLVPGVLVVVFIGLFINCGGDESETTNKTGSLAFQVQWEGTDASVSSDPSAPSAGQEALDCDGGGVYWVNAIIYDRINQYITESDPWHCYAHTGILDIPAGSDRKIVIFGKNANNEILYRGQKSHINVAENRITDAGLIVAHYFVPTGGDSTLCDVYPYADYSWQAVKSATSYEFQFAADESFASLKVNMIVEDPETGCFYFDGAYGATYYWRVRAIDFDGFKSAWSQTWSLIWAW